MEIGKLVNGTWTMIEIGPSYIPLSSYVPMIVITVISLIIIGLLKIVKKIHEKLENKRNREIEENETMG